MKRTQRANRIPVTFDVQEFAAIDVDRSGSISLSEYTNYILKRKQAAMKGRECGHPKRASPCTMHSHVCVSFKASSRTSAANTDGSDSEQQHDWDSDDSVCLMEDVEPAKAREMLLMKSVRVKPKLARMGEDVLLASKDSAMMRSKRWVKEREAQLQRDQSDVPVRFKEVKNVGFTQHRFNLLPNPFSAHFACQVLAGPPLHGVFIAHLPAHLSHLSSCNGMSIDWKNPLNRMHQPKMNKVLASRPSTTLRGGDAQFVEDNLPQPESGAICRLPILKHLFASLLP